MARIICLIALLMCSLSIYAAEKGVISGKIVDMAGEPLAGIPVQIQHTDMGSVTDSNGEFILENVPQGSQQLLITALGFWEKSIPLEVKTEVAIVLDNIMLEVKEQGLQEVLVLGRKVTTYVNIYSFMGTKTESRVKDLPQTISSVTKELIEDRQAFRIDEMVPHLAGVNQYSAYDDLTIRGFRNGWESGFRLVNGMRSGYGYGTSFFRVPLTVNLESIEVLKGPGAALFGDVSPGGTVNMVTKKPLEEHRQSINFTVGSFNTIRTALDLTGPLTPEGDLLYRLNIGYEDSKTFRDVNQRQSLMIAPTVTFRPSDRTTVNVEMVYSTFDGYLDRGMAIKAGDLYGLPRSFSISQPSDYFNVNDLNLSASFNHKLTNSLSFNAAYMKSLYHEDLAEHRSLGTYADSPANTVMNLRYMEKKIHETTDNLTMYLSWKVKTGKINHQLVGGMDYSQFQTDKKGHQWEARTYENNGEVQPLTFDLNNPTYELREPSHYIRLPLAPFFVDYLHTGYRTTGWYLQDQVKVSEKINLLLGLRHERFSDSRLFDQESEQVQQQVTLPRVGLTYTINENINFFTGYNEGFRPLSPQFIRNPENFGSESPFRPESSFQAEAGLKGEFLRKQLFGTLSFYHIERRNTLLHTGQVTDSGNPIYRQHGRIKSQGIETEWSGKLRDNLQLDFNYAYNLTEVLASEWEHEVGMPAPNAPRHSMGAWLKHQFQMPQFDGLGWGVGLTHVGNRRMENQVMEIDTGNMEWQDWPSYTKLDLSLFYQKDKFRFSLNLNNVTDAYYFIGGYDYLRAFPGSPRMLITSFGYTF